MTLRNCSRKLEWISAAIVVVLLVGFQGRQPATTGVIDATARKPQNRATFVRLSVLPAGKQDENHWRYRAVYRKGGTTARFLITFAIEGKTKGRSVDDEGQFSEEGRVKANGQPALEVRSGTGSIIAEPGSDASILLTDLKSALDAQHDAPHDIRIKALPFGFVVLGENLVPSSDPEKGYVESAHGRWIATKLFLGPESRKSQVFFSFERGGGSAEFSLKDSAYGDDVLRELAKVL